jgi:hypothetical protein
MAGRCETTFQFQHGHHAHWKQEVVLVSNCHAGITVTIHEAAAWTKTLFTCIICALVSLVWPLKNRGA